MAYPVLKAGNTWFTNSLSVSKTSITKVTVVDSYTPTGSEKSWDASAAGDGSIMVYVTGTELTIAGNGSGGIAANADSAEMFRNFSAVSTISGLELVDTSAVTTFEKAFAGCTSATDITDISGWDTARVGSVFGMFQQTYLLKDAPVSDWDMSSCTTARAMFQLAKGLSSVVLRWKAPLLTNASALFGCMLSPGAEYEECLEKIDFTECEFGSTLDASQMFIYRTKLTEVLGLDRIITPKCSTINKMFSECTALSVLDASGCDTSGCGETHAFLFNTPSLAKVSLGPKFSFDNFGKITSLVGSLPTPVGGRWYTNDGGSHLPSSIVDGEGRTFYAHRNMVEDFDAVVKNSVLMDIADATRTATGITDSLKPSQVALALQGFDYANVSNPVLDATFLSGCFREIIDKVVFVKEYIPEETPMFEWNADVGQTGAIRGYVGGSPPSIAFIELVEGEKIRLAPNSSGLFADMPALEEVRGIELLDTSNVMLFDRGFSGCESLKTVCQTDATTAGVVDLSCLTFPKMRSCNRLFEGCAHTESIAMWQGLTAVSYAMFHRCVNLRSISGFSNVTRIDDRAFVYTPALEALDFDTAKITYIGESACRLSSIESVVNLSNVAEVGNQATRLKRWPTKLSALAQVVATDYCPDDVELVVPNPDRQSNYPYIPFGQYQGRTLSVAAGGCSGVQRYHEWNAVHHKYGTGEVYANFPAWLEMLEAKGAVKYNNPQFKLSETNIEDGAIADILGWSYAADADSTGTKLDTRYVNDEKDMKNVLRRLSQGFPVEASMYSAHSVLKMHGILIVGFRHADRKFAIIDPNVWGVRGVVTWHSFEDIFDEHTKENYAGEPDNGMDKIRFVTNYNHAKIPTVGIDLTEVSE